MSFSFNLILIFGFEFVPPKKKRIKDIWVLISIFADSVKYELQIFHAIFCFQKNNALHATFHTYLTEFCGYKLRMFAMCLTKGIW